MGHGIKIFGDSECDCIDSCGGAGAGHYLLIQYDLCERFSRGTTERPDFVMGWSSGDA